MHKDHWRKEIQRPALAIFEPKRIHLYRHIRPLDA